MQNNFYKRSACWKLVLSKLFWKNTCWTCYILTFMHIFAKYVNVNVVCLKVCEMFLYFERVWNRYCIELCCISVLIGFRAMVIISEYIVHIDIFVNCRISLCFPRKPKNILSRNIKIFCLACGFSCTLFQ